MKHHALLTLSVVGALTFAFIAYAQQSQRAESQEPDLTDNDRDRADPAAMQGDNADGSGARSDAGADGLTRAGDAETAFYRQALTSGKGEVELSEHATTHARSADLRAFARRMLGHHAALNEKLQTTSGLRQAPPPPAADVREAESVKAASGDEYDRMWLDHMAKGHAKAIALYEDTSRNSRDADTRRLAEEALPTLRDHANSIDWLLGASADSAAAR